MVMVDTSVWIDYFKNRSTPSSVALKKILKSDEPICITGLIYTEILQGIKEDSLYEEIKEAISVFEIIAVEDIKIYENAIQIYRRARKSGHTIRKTIDCVIAAAAIEVGVPLFHNDRDFDAICAHSDLKVVGY